MARLLLGFFCALCLGLTVGCGGGSTETAVIESAQTAEEAQAEAEAYESEMEETAAPEGDG